MGEKVREGKGERKPFSLLRSISEPRRGPARLFGVEHVVLALFYIGRGPVGRKSLARQLGLGEGSSRTLIRRLEEAGIVESTRRGCELTDLGKEVLEGLSEILSEPARVEAGPLTVGEVDAAVLLRGFADYVGDGVEIRDAARAAGAEGATTLVVRGERVMFPDGVECPGEMGERAREVASALGAVDGDAIIIGTAWNLLRAKLGALAGALHARASRGEPPN